MITLKIILSSENLYMLIIKKGYEHIRIYQSTTIDGVYSEITDSVTRPLLQIGQLNYSYFVDVEPGTVYFKYTYANDTIESAQSEAFLTQPGDPDKIGHTFGNYVVPEGVFGEILTHDDMKHSFLWGIDLIAQDSGNSSWDEAQTRWIVDSAVRDFEKHLGIDIIRRKYKTLPKDTDRKVDQWMAGDANIYTDEEYGYDFNPDLWMNYGFLQLRHAPILSISRAELKGPTLISVLDLLDWKRVNKKVGQVHFFPTNQMVFGPPGAGYASMLMWAQSRYTQAFELDYETGFETAAQVPSDLREVIGKWGALKMLGVIGDGLLAGFSSQSVSLDGLSESFSSTQSATSAYFGARIMQYGKDIETWLKHNRYKYGGIPMGFVGGL